MSLRDSTILVTGGMRSSDYVCAPWTLDPLNPCEIIIYSRDEMEHSEMAESFQGYPRPLLFSGKLLIETANFPRSVSTAANIGSAKDRKSRFG
jgi:FlaA1/EpsC-like NDP-sugar epimerase